MGLNEPALKSTYKAVMSILFTTTPGEIVWNLNFLKIIYNYAIAKY